MERQYTVCDSIYMNAQNTQIDRLKVDLWLPATNRGGNAGNMCRVSVWGDENVLVLDSGEYCTVTLKELNCAF